MAKGTHNKTHKRNQSVIAKVLKEKIYDPRTKSISERLIKRTLGQGDDSLIQTKKNKFRYPNDPDAVYPQEKKPEYIERRAAYLPSKYLVRNILEKKKNVYKRELEELKKNEMDKASGKLNEGKVIDIEDVDDLVDDIEDMEIGNNKESKEKDVYKDFFKNIKKANKENAKTGMEIEESNFASRHKLKKMKRGHKHKRHSKNTMNF